MYISGWGNNLVVKSNVIYPRNINEIKKIIVDHKYKGILVRGMGRSYGDAALNENIISLGNLDIPSNRILIARSSNPLLI